MAKPAVAKTFILDGKVMEGGRVMIKVDRE
jgi:hypothetical protein